MKTRREMTEAEWLKRKEDAHYWDIQDVPFLMKQCSLRVLYMYAHYWDIIACEYGELAAMQYYNANTGSVSELEYNEAIKQAKKDDELAQRYREMYTMLSSWLESQEAKKKKPWQTRDCLGNEVEIRTTARTYYSQAAAKGWLKY